MIIITKNNKLWIYGKENREIILPGKIIMVSCGKFHTAVVTKEGKVFMFGLGNSGQLGTGDKQNKLVPTEIMMGTKVKMVRCGSYHTAVLTKEGKLFMFGLGYAGGLGTGDTQSRLLPTEITSVDKVAMVSCGDNHTAVLTKEGKVFIFGNGNYGQFVLPMQDRSIPTELTLESKAIMISCGGSNTAVLTNEGKVFIFGVGNFIQPTIEYEEERLVPTEVIIRTETDTLASKVTMVSCGGQNVTVLTEEGKLFMISSENYNQKVSVNGLLPSSIPIYLTEIMLGTKVKMVSCSGNYIGIIY